MTEQIEQTAGNSVLVLYLPVGTPGKLSEMRDYVAESLRKGVLVLAHGTEMQLKQLPDLGSVEIVPPDPEQLKKPEKVPEQGTGVLRENEIRFMGACSAEKTRIHQRLCDYRKEKGLGSWDALAAAAGRSSITVDVLRELYGGEISVSIEEWRAIDKGLTRLGFRVDNKGGADG